MELLVRKSLYQKLAKLDNTIMNTTEDVLYNVAFDIVKFTLSSTNKNTGNLGAVDSGSYLESFSIMSSRAGKIRSVPSKGRPRGVSPKAVGSKVLSTLSRDVARVMVSIESTQGNRGPKVTVMNGSRYARDVEYKYGYRIFSKLRKIYG